MKLDFNDFLLSGRFSEGLHNLAAAGGYGAMIYVFVYDAMKNGLSPWKMLVFGGLVCGIPTAQAVIAKWIRTPDGQPPGAAP